MKGKGASRAAARNPSALSCKIFPLLTLSLSLSLMVELAHDLTITR